MALEKRGPEALEARLEKMEKENRLLKGCGLAFLLLIGAAVAMGHAKPKQSQPENIRIGAEVDLGMSEESAIKKILEAGYSVKKRTAPGNMPAVTSMWEVDEKKDDGSAGQFVGMIFFSNGTLTSASRYSLPNDSGEGVEFGRQLFFMMRDFETRGDASCRIETRSGEVPEYAGKTAFFHCGHKTIALYLQQLRGQPESVQLNEELNQ
jgi:hypothetical protein